MKEEKTKKHFGKHLIPLHSRKILFLAIFTPLILIAISGFFVYQRHMALQYLEKDVFFVEKLVSIYQMDKEKRDPVKVHETFVEDLFSSLRLLEEETRFYGQLCSDIAFDQLYLGVLQRKDFLQGRQNQLSWTKKEESDRIIWQLDRAVEMNAYDLHAFVSAMEGDDYKLEENGGERPYLYFSNVEVSPYFEGAFDTYRVNFKIIQKRNK